MTKISRRALLATAAALGATAAFAGTPSKSRSGWREARELFPEGVASGDPDSTSVILWTRRPFGPGHKTLRLIVEVAEDRAFEHVVAATNANAPEESDWTARVLVGGLKPATEYWYRFTDERKRQPHRPHDHRARRRRPAPSKLRFRLLPECQLRRAERVSPYDL
jgi:alkaline phosphatase D